MSKARSWYHVFIMMVIPVFDCHHAIAEKFIKREDAFKFSALSPESQLKVRMGRGWGNVYLMTSKAQNYFYGICLVYEASKW